MRRPITSLLAVAAAGVLSLSACSGQGTAQSGKASGSDEAEMGPLYEYMSALWTGQEWTQEMYDEENLKREELIAQCMAKEGFEYIPNTQNATTVWTDEDVEGPAWGSLEFAQNYGYGVVDWPGRADMETQEPTEWVDPNQDYVDSLSPSEQEAFWQTLYGQPAYPEDGEDGNEEAYEYRWEDNGCWGWAEHEVNAGRGDASSAWEDPEFADLLDAMTAMNESLMTDPDVATANQEWAACMEGAGFPGFAAREDARNSMYERQNAIYEEAGAGEEWVEPSQEEMDALQSEEIALATADWKCADQVNYDARLQEVDFRLQQEFLDRYRTQLEALLTKYASASQSS